jgi:heme A synthase
VVFVASLLGVLVAIPVLIARRRRSPAGEPEPGPRAPGGEAAPEDGAASEDEAAPEDEPLRFREVPFGPFLALAALVYLFFWPDVQAALGLWAPR